MEENYHKILAKLSEVSGVAENEIERRVEAKRAKLSGLISREGALQVIAAELGISFDDEKLKINELLPGMRKVNFTGKIITLYPIRTFRTKDGGEGKVANMVVADDTANIKVVLWDTNHIEKLESGEISEGSVIEISSGAMRENEVHMGSFSDLKKSNETFEDLKTEKPIKEKTISEFNPGESVKLRAFVVQSFEPRFYEVNLDSGKKVTEEELASGVPTEKRAILNVTIDDGTENIRAVLFHENVQKAGVKSYDNQDLMKQEVQNLLGRELVFSGNIRRNSYSGNYELVVNSVEDLDLDSLIKEMEA
jgi:ssDNA-binding replication factor A large subunit